MNPFWLIGYGRLVWDRTITAFVPISVLNKVVDSEVMDRFRFMDEAECDYQVSELHAIGCTDAHKKGYGTGKKVT